MGDEDSEKIDWEEWFRIQSVDPEEPRKQHIQHEERDHEIAPHSVTFPS